MQVNMLEAKNALSRLVAAAERGEDVILARDGKPVAKIVRYDIPKVKPPGAWKGKVKVSPNWDSLETNAEVAVLFEASAMRGL
jgi:prevent-host-death family protein